MNLNYILLLLHVMQTRMGIQEGYLQCPSIPPAPPKAAYFSRTALHQAPCINNMTDVLSGDLPVWKAKSHSTAKAGGKSRVKETGTSSPPASLPRLFIIIAWDTLCSRVQNSSSGDFCSFTHLSSLQQGHILSCTVLLHGMLTCVSIFSSEVGHTFFKDVIAVTLAHGCQTLIREKESFSILHLNILILQSMPTNTV